MNVREAMLEAGLDPGAESRRLLELATVCDAAVLEGTELLYVFRFHDVEPLLHHPRLAGVGLCLFDRLGIQGGPRRNGNSDLMSTNGGLSDHRLRRLVAEGFTPAAVGGLRAHAADTVTAALTPLVGEGGDLIEALRRVPMSVMCRLLGVPDALVADFAEWVAALGPVFGLMTDGQIAGAEAALEPLSAALADIVEMRAKEPADDLLSALIHAEADGNRLTRTEAVAVAVNLLAGGHATTTGQLGCTLLTLLSQPEILRLATAEPELIPAIVTESIRLSPSLDGIPRTATEPLEVCGALRPAGTMLLLCTLTANRDPQVWTQPDAFLPRRSVDAPTPRVLSFGSGARHCLGAALAKLTLVETVRGIAQTMPILCEEPTSIPWGRSPGRSPARLLVMM